MKQTQRHDAIIELVKKQGYVSTEELVEQLPSAHRPFVVT
ncbi:Glycerol-3-phosphate regulon repressor [Raoultella planticola]|uniref:Glycerol-3-phosphate regulon repressor n=1 Tax=Raoultella planticola TaxID=575 RepID=A0A485CM90_RAOPL|nr:Glycerol-3-phosphate regulon repressor [Raoultella planticola]